MMNDNGGRDEIQPERPRHTVQVDSSATGDDVVVIDGRPIGRCVSSVQFAPFNRVTVELVTSPRHAELKMENLAARVAVGSVTRDVLISMGWTPPAESVPVAEATAPGVYPHRCEDTVAGSTRDRRGDPRLMFERCGTVLDEFGQCPNAVWHYRPAKQDDATREG